MVLPMHKESFVKWVLFALASVSVIFSIVITGFLLLYGLPGFLEIGFQEFMTVDWAPTGSSPQFGIIPFILSSIVGTLGALLISVPIGICCALYLAKGLPRRVSILIRFLVDILSAIPSVVYGLLGMIIIVPAIRVIFQLPDGASLLAAILVLAVMILPTFITIAETAIRAVPKEYEEASLALGANRWETLVHVVLPAAKSGILAAMVLGIGRAIGETMAVIMVSGNVANMPELFSSVRFLTTAVASEMAYSSGVHQDALFSIALVLFAFIILLNVSLQIIINKANR